ILARNGVQLNVRNSAGGLENLNLLRDPASGVQGAPTSFGLNEPTDPETLNSLGGIFDAAIFILPERSADHAIFRIPRQAHCNWLARNRSAHPPDEGSMGDKCFGFRDSGRRSG